MNWWWKFSMYAWGLSTLSLWVIAYNLIGTQYGSLGELAALLSCGTGFVAVHTWERYRG